MQHLAVWFMTAAFCFSRSVRSRRNAATHYASSADLALERIGFGLDVDKPKEKQVPRTKTHKIAIQTKGLTHEQAALLYYLLTSATEAVLKGESERYESASNIPLKVLRSEYPESNWSSATAKDRAALVS